MNELIKRIKAHDGEVKVTPENDNKVVVEFVTKKLIAVIPDNKEQWEFIQSRIHLFTGYAQGYFIVISRCQCGVSHKSDYNIIPFTKYISDNDLKDEWEKYLIGEAEKRGFKVGCTYELNNSVGRIARGCLLTTHMSRVALNYSGSSGLIYDSADGQWATIIEPKLGLVKGEMYYSTEESWNWLFRYKSEVDKIRADYYSGIDKEGDFYTKSYVCYVDLTRLCKPATNKQKAKLIEAEIKNGWLWDGKELVKL